jgi:accessory gene regulator B
MIDTLAERIAIHVNERNNNVVSIAVMKFALIIIINILTIITTVLLLGLLTDKFKESALALMGFAMLRFFSGGLHVKSAAYCVLVSAILVSIIIYIPIPKEYELGIQIISSLLVLIFAPAHIENHIRIKKKYVPFLKIMSLCIVGSNFYWNSSILIKCFLLQSISLIEIIRKGGGKNENTSI